MIISMSCQAPGHLGQKLKLIIHARHKRATNMPSMCPPSSRMLPCKLSTFQVIPTSLPEHTFICVSIKIKNPRCDRQPVAIIHLSQRAHILVSLCLAWVRLCPPAMKTSNYALIRPTPETPAIPLWPKNKNIRPTPETPASPLWPKNKNIWGLV